MLGWATFIVWAIASGFAVLAFKSNKGSADERIGALIPGAISGLFAVAAVVMTIVWLARL